MAVHLDTRDSQPFSSCGTHKLSTKIMQLKKKPKFFSVLTKKDRYNLIHWHQAIVLAVVRSKGKQVSPLAKYSCSACCGGPVENHSDN